MALKLSPEALLILAALSDEPRHGYALKKHIAAQTAGDVRLGSTTLYRLLGQLLDQGLIEEQRTRPSPALDDERRRYYRVTAAGRRALAAERQRFERLLVALRSAGGTRAR
jgi:DNA-binding PadR family transcriptional regulator